MSTEPITKPEKRPSACTGQDLISWLNLMPSELRGLPLTNERVIEYINEGLDNSVIFGDAR